MVLEVKPEGIGFCKEGVVWYRTVDHGVIENLSYPVGKAVEKAMHEEELWLMGVKCAGGSEKVCLGG